MIKLVEYRKPKGLQPNEFIVTLFADTKAEVTEGAEISGMSEGDIISSGSSIYTADGNVAFRTSQNAWAWQ